MGAVKIRLKRWGGVCELAPNLIQLISIGSIISKSQSFSCISIIVKMTLVS